MGLTTKYQQALSSLNEIHCENCEVDKVQAFFRRGSFISILIPLIANQQKEVGGGGLVQAGKKIACLLFACGIREGRDKNVTCQSDKKRKKGSTATEGSVNRVRKIYYPRLSLNFLAWLLTLGVFIDSTGSGG